MFIGKLFFFSKSSVQKKFLNICTHYLAEPYRGDCLDTLWKSLTYYREQCRYGNTRIPPETDVYKIPRFPRCRALETPLVFAPGCGYRKTRSIHSIPRARRRSSALISKKAYNRKESVRKDANGNAKRIIKFGFGSCMMNARETRRIYYN